MKNSSARENSLWEHRGDINLFLDRQPQEEILIDK
jgi:hypothetical protein